MQGIRYRSLGGRGRDFEGIQEQSFQAFEVGSRTREFFPGKFLSTARRFLDSQLRCLGKLGQRCVEPGDGIGNLCQ